MKRHTPNQRFLSLLLLLESLPDPRDESRRIYPLINIVFVALCAVIGGAKSWETIAEFGEDRKEWFSQLIDLSKGIPSHDTFRRVFSLLDPAQMEKCFRDLIRQVTKQFQDEVIAIDGKSKRDPFDKKGGAVFLHMAHVWATQQQLLVGCKVIKGAPNEPEAFKELLGLLDLEGAIVTGDANNSTQGITQVTRERKGQYVLALKKNHHDVYEEIERSFQDVTGMEYYQEEEKNHGREEKREIWITKPSEKLKSNEKWKDLNTIIRMKRRRKNKDKEEENISYYIASLEVEASKLAKTIRHHWKVESELHWSLDVIYGEDDSRIQEKRQEANLAMIRRLAFCMLKRETSKKGSLVTKQAKAGWNTSYLEKVLAAGLPES